MKAGNLNKRVDLLRRRPGTDGVGQPHRDYDRWATVWASVEPLTAKEMRAAQQPVNVTDIVIAFRWIPDVLPIDRVRLPDGRVADVVSVVDPKLEGAEIQLLSKYVAEAEHSGDGRPV
jgi:SPP1 family predicted phage head-tail adaptor